MKDDKLRATVSTIPRLRACAVLSASNGALRASYQRSTEIWDAGRLAEHIADVVQATARTLGQIDAGGEAEVLTIEARKRRISLVALDDEHVAAFVFDRDARLGMVRHRVLEAKPELNALLKEQEPAPAKGAMVLQFLERNAPDTHAALLRVSLQTGLPMALLRAPESLSEAELESVSTSVRQILGVQSLGVES